MLPIRGYPALETSRGTAFTAVSVGITGIHTVAFLGTKQGTIQKVRNYMKFSNTDQFLGCRLIQ